MRKLWFIPAIFICLALAFASAADTELDAALNADGGSIAFTNDASYPWEVIEENGRLAAMSGNAGAASSVSAIAAVVTVEAGQSIEFDWNVDCEASTTIGMWDYLAFCVDGSIVDFIRSEEENTPLGWQHCTWTPDEPGSYTLSWEYVKDASVDGGADRGYLDNVAVTGEIIVPPTPTPAPLPGEEFTVFHEDFSVSPEEWWNDDFDGDGNYWQWSASYGHDAPGAIFSYSYDDWSGPLTPDNQACTPEFDIPEEIESASLSFWLCSMDDEYCAEHIDLFVVRIYETLYGGFDIEYISQLDSITLSDGDWHEFTYDLTEYAGYEGISIAFVHCDVTDQYGIYLDDVDISAVMGGGTVLPGDSNGDGVIDFADVSRIMRYILRLMELDGNNLIASDYNGDGTIDFIDVNELIRSILHLN